MIIEQVSTSEKKRGFAHVENALWAFLLFKGNVLKNGSAAISKDPHVMWLFAINECVGG